MPWSYDPNLVSDVDQVRFLIGDTLSTDPQLQNEEISAFLTIHANDVRATAIAAARALSARYTRQADKWVGDLKILNSQKSRQYARLAEDLGKSSSASISGIPSAGGISVSKKEMAEEDEDRVVPFFKRGMHDNTD